GAGYFYLQAGSVVDARIGVLHGIDAVYYALTLPNAQFEFSADAETKNRTINQPWTQVVLEGLRRLDENISPGLAFPADYVPEADELAIEPSKQSEAKSETERSFAPAFLALAKESGGRRKPVFIAAIAVAILASVAVIGVPAGWYKSSSQATASAEAATPPAAPPQNTPAETPAQPQPTEANAAPSASEDAEAAAKRQREKEKRAREAARNAETAGNTVAAQPAAADAGKAGAKRVVVTVTYDESGRVTQASGGDANALRIARQKRFPPGKAGSATITIPIN
ncbi:MAG TPA: DUF4388 domain-containing protein, partial [Pyrinomonadaceae bacterium]|nr:DUF4388 domain-containing protein [Pyrinomonadaceae bacterium]